MSNWQPAGLANLPAEQRALLEDVDAALGDLSHHNDLDGPVMVAPATDGHIRLILGPTVEGDNRSPQQLAEDAAHRLAGSGLRLTVDLQRLAEGYAVRVARRSGRPEVGRPVMIRFPEEMLAQVDARAEAAGSSRAAVIRDLVTAGLNGEE